MTMMLMPFNQSSDTEVDWHESDGSLMHNAEETMIMVHGASNLKTTAGSKAHQSAPAFSDVLFLNTARVRVRVGEGEDRHRKVEEERHRKIEEVVFINSSSCLVL